MLYSLQGIVIKNIDYGESDKIINVYTPELGKISLMVRGAKKIKSKHTAVTQLFTCGEFSFHKQPGKMGTLHQAEITHSFQNLRHDLTKTAFAAYLAEMVERLIHDEEASSYLYAQFSAALHAMDENKEPAIVAHIFEMKMLRFQGYTPQLDHCVSCQAENQLHYFSSQLGGMLCEMCRMKDRYAPAITEPTWKILKLFLSTDLRQLGQIQVKPATKTELNKVMRAYMDQQLEVVWKTRKFIDQMEKYLY